MIGAALAMKYVIGNLSERLRQEDRSASESIY